MAFAYSSTIQDDIALLLARKSYSALGTDQSKIIDGGAATSPPTKGAAGRAWTALSSLARLLNLAAPDEIPDAWSRWFILEAAADAANAFSRAEDEDLAQAARVAKIEAYQTFSLLDASDEVSPSDMGLSVASVRRYVMSSAASGDAPATPNVSTVDTSLESVLSKLWNMAEWSFRRKEVTLTLATDGTVTASPSVTIDKVISSQLFYTGGERGVCQLADRETMQDWLSNDDIAAGKPEFFMTTKAGSAVTLVFNRTADQEYQMLATVSPRLGAISDTDSMNTALGLVTSEFVPMIRDWVLGSVLVRMGDRRGRGILQGATEEVESMAYTADATEAEEKTDSHRVSRRRTLGGPRGWGDCGGFV